MITHVVLFKLKDRSPENIGKTRDILAGLKDKVQVLKHLEVGTDVVRGERSYDIALVARFDTLDDLEAYRVHPAHQEVVEYIKTVKESTVAVDYES